MPRLEENLSLIHIYYSSITSTGLNRVEYKVNKVTCGTSAAAYWGYTSSRTISSGAALPSLPNGCYQFYVRGVNTAGTEMCIRDRQKTVNTITANEMMIQEQDLSAKAKVIFQYLAFRSNKENRCFPALKTIARECSISVSSVPGSYTHLMNSKSKINIALQILNGLIF